MYSQEIYIFFMIFFHLHKFGDWAKCCQFGLKYARQERSKILPSRWKSPMELIKCGFTFILKHTGRVGKVWQSRTVDWKTVGSFHGHRAHPNASKGTHSQPPNTRACVPQEQHAVCSPGSVGLRRPLCHSSGGGGLLTPPVRPEPSTLLPAHSSPKVLVSSTAVKSFSYSMEKEGYGGRSRRLKQVWALQTEEIWCALVGGAEKNKSASSGAHVRMRVRWCACTRTRAHPQECLSLAYSSVSVTIFTVIFGKVKMF